MKYMNETVDKLDKNKFTGNLKDLALIPADYSPDEQKLRVIFNTSALTRQPDNSPFLDQQGKPMGGVLLVMSILDTLHTGRCSLHGLVTLSKDPRVISYRLGGPV